MARWRTVLVGVARCSVGVTLFTLASFACAYAPSLEWLIGARFVQALGGCAGMVISRAVVSDKCDAVGSAKVFSQLMLVTGLAPILAPLAGGVMVGLWGWQSIFLALTIFSVMAGHRRGVRLAGNLSGPPAAPAVVWLAAPLLGRCCRDRVYLGYALTGGFRLPGCLPTSPAHRSCLSNSMACPPSITAGCSAPTPRASSWWRSSTRACWPSVARRFCCRARCGCICWRA